MLGKFFKYAALLEAEVVSSIAMKIKEVSDDFVKKNSDLDYEESLEDMFNNVREKVKSLSPKIEKVTNSVNRIRDNILDFPKKIS
ncbi:MAG: hypothetical protein H7263_15540 [Candidatus Sericytochromatia bacterium]|nr:hypothetical protein [Candidatus Sericytochromatia bacterium]